MVKIIIGLSVLFLLGSSGCSYPGKTRTQEFVQQSIAWQTLGKMMRQPRRTQIAEQHLVKIPQANVDVGLRANEGALACDNSNLME